MESKPQTDPVPEDVRQNAITILCSLISIINLKSEKKLKITYCGALLSDDSDDLDLDLSSSEELEDVTFLEVGRKRARDHCPQFLNDINSR
jgi:hypothetical protein